MSGRKVSPQERERRQRQQDRQKLIHQARREGVTNAAQHATAQQEESRREALQSLDDFATEEGLLLQLGHEAEKFDALSDAYAKLRRKLINTRVKLYHAHTIVSSAAVRHRDEKLAACAREHLNGMSKLDAEAKILRASEVLAKAGL